MAGNCCDVNAPLITVHAHARSGKQSGPHPESLLYS